MGLTLDGAQFMMAAKGAGVSFERTLILGRQWSALSRSRLKAAWHQRGLPGGAGLADEGAWADDVFRALGATTLDVLDNSPYEGATVIQDLNRPVDQTHRDRYDIVFDGGVLEHVFNMPAAIENCMRMVRKGGHFIMHSISNNELGHGFYQFSPELFYRLFTPAHGFHLRSIVLVELGWRSSTWYAVRDAAELGARVCCINRRPLYILVLAQKVGPVPDALDVQQADYMQAWSEATPSARVGITAPSHVRPGLKESLLRVLPAPAVELLKDLYRRYFVARLYNRRFYRRLDPASFTLDS